ncbi:MAG: hypothetical protein WCF79_18530 [Rhodomicrobium sp.]
MLGAQLLPAAGLATLRRQGMAAWIKTAGARPDLPPALLPARRPPATIDGPATNELTRILASLVVTLTMESAHA